MRCSRQTTTIMLERGDEDVALLAELRDVLNLMLKDGHENLCLRYPVLDDFVYALMVQVEGAGLTKTNAPKNRNWPPARAEDAW